MILLGPSNVTHELVAVRVNSIIFHCLIDDYMLLLLTQLFEYIHVDASNAPGATSAAIRNGSAVAAN